MSACQQSAEVVIDFSQLSDLCTLMPRRLLVSGILVQWLRTHFSDPANIDSELLQEAVWNTEIAETGILIDTVFKFNAAQTETRPGVFIKPGPWKVIRYGIDDRLMGGTVCGSPNRVVNSYTTMFQGSHTVFCIAGESAEAEILACEVYRELIQFGPAARKLFNFLRFVVSDIGEPAILEEATENFVVPVTISYGCQESWAMGPLCAGDVAELINQLWQDNRK